MTKHRINKTKVTGTSTLVKPSDYHDVSDFIDAVLEVAVAHGVAGKRKNQFCTMATLLTPDLATHLLENLHVRQRRVSLHAVGKMVRDYRNGNWCAYGDNIHIDTKGKLINGQRRCHLVQSVGEPIQLNLVVASDDRAYSSMDAGQSRSTFDHYIALTGDRSLTRSQALTASLFEMDNFRDRGTSAIDRALSVRQYDQLDDTRFLLQQVSKHVSWNSGRVAAALRCMRHDHKRAALFFTAIFRGHQFIEDEGVCRPITQVQRALLEKWENTDRTWGYPKKAAEAHYAFEAYLHWYDNPVQAAIEAAELTDPPLRPCDFVAPINMEGEVVERALGVA